MRREDTVSLISQWHVMQSHTFSKKKKKSLGLTIYILYSSTKASVMVSKVWKCRLEKKKKEKRKKEIVHDNIRGDNNTILKLFNWDSGISP